MRIGNLGCLITSCSEASGRPKRIFSRTEPWNKKNILQDNAHLAAQAFQGQFADIFAIQ
jgi:hypothetical protein